MTAAVSAGPPGPELHRPVAASRIGVEAQTFTVAADAAECAAVAARLGIVAVAALACDFALRRGEDAARGQITANGMLRARVVQDCVVSLEPFEAAVEEAFLVQFVQAGTEIDDLDLEADDEIPYGGDTLDLGDAAVEQLALALDPYPRKPGVALPDEALGGALSPFAALARRMREN